MKTPGKAFREIYIMSGYNQRAVIAFLRYLERKVYQHYSIIAAGDNDPILNTPYKKHVVFIRREKTLSIDEFKVLFRKEIREGIFMPSTESLVRFQLDHRSFFEERGICIPVVEKSLYETISDKRKFWELCRNNGFFVPAIYRNVETAVFPLVAKPKTYFTSSRKTPSPVMLSTIEELNRFIVGHNIEDYDLQQFITGDSYYLLYHIGRDGTVCAFSQKNILQQPNGKSMIAALPAHIHEEDICKKYGALLKDAGFHGLIMIELRKQDDVYYMIEANPRMWGPSQLFVDAGVDFFGHLLNDYGAGIAISKQPPDFTTKYYWSGGGSGNYRKYLISANGSDEFDIDSYMKYDVYKRADTMEIYHLEGSGAWTTESSS